MIRNNNKRAAALAVVLLLAMALLAGCGSGGISSGKAEGTTVVALTASSAEILYALGGGDMLVGRGEYCDWPPEIAEVPTVSSGDETNVEQIIALKPDLVLMATMAQSPEQAAQLEEAGIEVYTSDASTIEETYVTIEEIGALIGKEAEAADVIASMQETFETVAADKVDGGTIYFEVSPLEYGLWTVGEGTFMDEAAGLVGLTNIFADLEGYAEVSEEQVIERNPDYILTITMYYGEGAKPVDELLARSGWENVTAIQNGAILELPNNELSRPGPRLAEGVQALSDFVHGIENG
ncbi:MAG: ABC transporter substrate-binding protein [Clostridiales Family XIII bacterium]|nr:ABC transporter substrate-binding protein [Clostridiales Family XIII bacterium]